MVVQMKGQVTQWNHSYSSNDDRKNVSLEVYILIPKHVHAYSSFYKNMSLERRKN